MFFNNTNANTMIGFNQVFNFCMIVKICHTYSVCKKLIFYYSAHNVEKVTENKMLEYNKNRLTLKKLALSVCQL